MRVIEALVEMIVGHPVGDYVKITFTWPAPEHSDVLEEIYGAPREFDAPETSLSIPASWRTSPRPVRRKRLPQQYRQVPPDYCRTGSRPRYQRTGRSILANHFDRVRLGERSGMPAPSLEAMAEQLHTTPRTLIRRLKRQDCAYRTLLEAAQLECATTCCSRPPQCGGYCGEWVTATANFGRAFRKMTVTPAAWRRGQRADSGGYRPWPCTRGFLR